MRWTLLMRSILVFFFIGMFFLPAALSIPTQTHSNAEYEDSSSALVVIERSTVYAQMTLDSEIERERSLRPSISLWTLIRGKHSFVETFSAFMYWIVLTPLFYILRFIGSFLDLMIFISISSGTYSELGFIQSGWEIVRDIANIGFIFALLYVAIGLVFDIGNINVKKLLINIIIVALVINFSLFMTRVVLDTTNILSRVFYNNINISIDSQSTYSGQIEYSGNEQETRELSGLILARINPQALLTSDLITSPQNINGQRSGQRETQNVILFVIIMLIILYVILISIFVSVSLLFLLRIVSIAIAMIIAPLAFATLMFPGGSGIKKIGFSNWLSDFLKAAFMAPVFLFFFYIILQFLSTSWIQINPGSTFWIRLMQIIIPFSILIGLLQAAKSVAIKMSGEAGEKIAGFAGKAAGAVAGIGAGLATGGSAMLATKTLGSTGAALANSDTVNKMRQSDSFATRAFGNLAAGAGNKLSTASFDFRNTSLGKKAFEKAGINDDLGGASMFNSKTKGGYQGQLERAAAEKDTERKRREALIDKSDKADDLRDKQDEVQTLQEILEAIKEDNAKDIKDHDSEINDKKSIMLDLQARSKADPTNTNLKDAATDAKKDYDKAQKDKETFMDKKVTEATKDTDTPYTSQKALMGDISAKQSEIRKGSREINQDKKVVREKYANQVENSEQIKQSIESVLKISLAGVTGLGLLGGLGAVAGGVAMGAADKVDTPAQQKRIRNMKRSIKNGWSLSSNQGQNIPQQGPPKN